MERDRVVAESACLYAAGYTASEVARRVGCGLRVVLCALRGMGYRVQSGGQYDRADSRYRQGARP